MLRQHDIAPDEAGDMSILRAIVVFVQHFFVIITVQGKVSRILVECYAEQGALPVVNDLQDMAVPVYQADLIEHPDAETIRAYTRAQGAGMQAGLHLMRHDSAKLAALIMQLAAESA